MARILAIVALALTASFAGCLDGGLDADFDEDGLTVTDSTSSSHGRSSFSTTRDLGSVSGSSVQPSRFDFTVEVPAGGARSVSWQMTIETSGNSILNGVEGPGCSVSGTSLTVLGTNTFSGRCDDLGVGNHTFTAVLGSPALAFEASVRGQITVVTEW
ncbi:MAG: hypothetical protein AABY18_09030 [Candidatus Thermoplasmatota archaeon]